jgi:hypothetical protein
LDKIIEWLMAKFQQPLSLLFFVVGAMLIFFGLSTGFKIKGMDIAPNGHPWLILSVGIAFCGLAVLIYYLPSRAGAAQRRGEEEDITGSFVDLLDEPNLVTSEVQKRILNLFLTLPGGLVRQEEITKLAQQKVDGLKNVSWSEIYYRLEQLRWMGFLTKRRNGPEYLYGLSSAYRRYLEKH